MRESVYELGINHQSPLIYWSDFQGGGSVAGNQSPIPFDILERVGEREHVGWESITNPL